MTSKRLGILVLALAAVWSLAGLDWLAPNASHQPRSVLAVNSAQAGFEDFLTGYQTCSLEGDPDQYVNGAEGGSGDFSDGSAADTTASETEAPENSTSKTSKISVLLEALMNFARATLVGVWGVGY
jgi:hypothetical protein